MAVKTSEIHPHFLRRHTIQLLTARMYTLNHGPTFNTILCIKSLNKKANIPMPFPFFDDTGPPQ